MYIFKWYSYASVTSPSVCQACQANFLPAPLSAVVFLIQKLVPQALLCDRLH